MTEAGQVARRYELDWLRVLAFALLIFYHTGMLYVERWGFHYKSQYLSSTLEYLMLASSPWRMLLIWLISGYALGTVLLRVSHWQQYGQLALKRTVVLLLPLMVGLWFIVPPQLYAEMVQKDGLSLSYWQLPWCAALVGLKTNHVFTPWPQCLGYALGLTIVTPLALTCCYSHSRLDFGY